MRRGFNILEIIMATGILAVIFLAVISLFLAFHGSDRYAGAVAQASDVAQAEMGRIKALPYETLEGYVTTALPPYALERQGQAYNVTVSAVRVGTSLAQPDYKLLCLRVRLTWKQKKSIDRQGEKQAALREVETSTELTSVVAPEAKL